jgi:prepilin-type N-terminal cleavage/methylation domain-containing protein
MNIFCHGKSKQQGFTLMELMVVTAIIALILSIAIPNYISYRNHGYCSSVETDAQNCAAAISGYFSDPDHIEVPDLVDLVGFEPDNQITIGGDIDLIQVTVTDVSQRCPKGSTYFFTMPNDSTNGWM